MPASKAVIDQATAPMTPDCESRAALSNKATAPQAEMTVATKRPPANMSDAQAKNAPHQGRIGVGQPIRELCVLLPNCPDLRFRNWLEICTGWYRVLFPKRDAPCHGPVRHNTGQEEDRGDEQAASHDDTIAPRPLGA